MKVKPLVDLELLQWTILMSSPGKHSVYAVYYLVLKLSSEQRFVTRQNRCIGRLVEFLTKEIQDQLIHSL